MASPLALSFGLTFDEAIAAAKRRGVLLPKDYAKLRTAIARRAATTVSRLTVLDQIQRIIDSVVKAMVDGTAFGEWQRTALAQDWKLPAGRLECLPGDNLVSGAVVRAGHRRSYQGRIVEVVTNNGRKFTATPNHPMLTRRGWVAAGGLNSADDLIGCRRNKDSGATGNQQKHERPTHISEVFVALSKAAITERIHAQRLDFHGDGSDCNVEVVRSARDLPLGDFAAIRQPFGDLRFTEPNFSALRFCRFCGHLIVVSQRCGVCDRPNTDPGRSQFRVDEIVTGSISRREGVSAFSGDVPCDQIADRNIITEAGGQATISEMQAARIAARSAYSCLSDDAANPSVGGADGCGDSFDALPGDIEFDRVASLRVLDFCGHVYNLSTAHGYYLLDGLYTGNTIFRTNVQTAYSAGHWEAFKANKSRRPYLMWSAINDARVRPTHLAMDGYIAPVDDPIWREWHAPAGYNCRCTQISLTEAQALARGFGRQARPWVHPDPGFEGSGGPVGVEETVADAEARKLAEADPRLRHAYGQQPAA